MKRWHLPADTIFHSNRSSQYTSEAVMSLLKKYGIKQSFYRWETTHGEKASLPI